MKHPMICPKCGYSRPLGLTYCPNCRNGEKKTDLKKIVKKVEKKKRGGSKKKK